MLDVTSGCERYSDRYCGGINAGGVRHIIAGTQRYCPVKGGLSFPSRAMCARTAVMLPPAEPPPMMKPREGSAPRDAAFCAACPG